MFNVGDAVTGADFIGREKDINTLVRLIREKRNVRIQGLARIGKTSLAKEALARITNNPDLVGGNPPFFFQFSFTHDYKDRFLLFRNLRDFLKKCCDSLSIESTEVIEECNESFEQIDKDLSSDIISYYDYLTICTNIYENSGRMIWLVLDEMDYAGICLGSQIDKIRELIDNSDGCVRSINISRHSLLEIFPKKNNGSNYPGIVTSIISVVGYDNDDLALIRNIAEEYCGGIDDELWNNITYYAGNVPFLIELFSNEIEISISKDFASTLERIKDLLNDYFRNIYYTMCDMKMYDAYIQSLNGKLVDDQDLKAFGLIKDGKPAIPYLSEYLETTKQKPNDDLVGLYIRRQNDIDDLLSNGRKVARMLLGTDEGKRAIIEDSMCVLSAMKKKIEFLKAINEFQLSSNENIQDIVRVDLSESELSGFIQYCARFGNYIEAIDFEK